MVRKTAGLGDAWLSPQHFGGGGRRTSSKPSNPGKEKWPWGAQGTDRMLCYYLQSPWLVPSGPICVAQDSDWELDLQTGASSVN